MGAALGITGQVAGAVVGAVGNIITGQANAGAAGYNASVNRQNAVVARENAAIAGQAGAEQQFDAGIRDRNLVGNLKANEAAGGVDVNQGSAATTQGSAIEMGQLDAMTIRSNATKAAYGYEQQATSFEDQRNLDRFEKNNDATAGDISAGATFLGGVGSAANSFAEYQLQGGFSG